MKLIIQIPCYNEQAGLPVVIAGLRRINLPGIAAVEILVVDDGSSDDSPAAARAAGADAVICLKRHAGLAAAFQTGLDACLARGADLIVNIDADGQYDPADLPALLSPLLNRRAEISVGDRGVAAQPGVSPLRRMLQRLGSRVVAAAAGIPVPDAASGFRAYTREAALRTVVLGRYSYTLETLIQAGARGEAVAFVAVRSRAVARPSRLMRSPLDYLLHSAAAILRAYTLYRPLRVFFTLGALLLVSACGLAARYLVFFSRGQGAGHIQSVILAGVLLLAGLLALLGGLLADLLAANRRLLEEILYRERKAGLAQPPAAEN